MKQPAATRLAERALNPLIGKSLVLYARKPPAVGTGHGTPAGDAAAGRARAAWRARMPVRENPAQSGRRRARLPPPGAPRTARARPSPPCPAILTAAEILATGESIAAVQQPSGAIGWPDGHIDAWNHVECAMALSRVRAARPARRAYDWLRASQRADGSWPKQTAAGGVVTDPADREQPGRLRRGRRLARASGHRRRGVRGADVARGAQRRSSSCWACRRRAARSSGSGAADGTPGPLRPADRLLQHATRACAARSRWPSSSGEPQPDWELAAGQLGHVVASHPEAFADKSRFSMDWYYPVLGRPGARRRPARPGWPRAGPTSWCPGLGVRCVSDQPWVTGAETCELVLALDANGDHARAAGAVRRHPAPAGPDGGYWTGWQFVNRATSRPSSSSWTAAAMILAADALSGATGGAGLFRTAGPGRAVLPPADADACGCALPAPG